ncbi:MAG: BON domain-containing protein [Planctomycetes bacterium]|nr:BON domain-containing protein [Planctomycetota bacterium]
MDGGKSSIERPDRSGDPTGFRADSATLDRAREALAASPIQPLRELRVERHDDRLLVTGRVDSFYLKQLAQEIVRTVAEGLHVVNEIDVPA